MGFEQPGKSEKMERNFAALSEELERKETVLEKELGNIRLAKILLLQFSSGGTSLTDTFLVKENGEIGFLPETEKEKTAQNDTPIAAVFCGTGRTREELMSVAKDIQDMGVARFSFDIDNNRGRLTVTAEPFE